MKKVFMSWICLLLMITASQSAKAQDITITLLPGCTWISYTRAEAMSITTALGDFVPMEGDVIKSQYASTTYSHGRWMGRLQQFTPGLGYMYISMRGEPVSLVFATPPTPEGALVVTTSEATDITATTAICGGSAVSNDGTSILMKGVCWATHPRPTTNDAYSENGNGQGSFTAEITGLTPNTVYYVRAYAVSVIGVNYGEEVSFTTSDYAYVDLGLPSGNLWATCNVGATTPEDYGDYFAWGETQPKDTYNWDTYQYGYGYDGYDAYITKYTGSDGLTILLPEDDAATANWGDNWRMPNKLEWQELYNNTTCTWTTQNGVNGRLFTASNGNSLFLPAAGDRWDDELFQAGNRGFYWSSSLDTDEPGFALCLYFASNNYYMSCPDRADGISVRAVRFGSFLINATANPEEGGTVSGGGMYQDSTICTLVATANEGYVFTNWTENGDVVSTEAEYSFTVNSNRNLVANFVDPNVHSYVDLGLPSGTLWATCNVGAYVPEAYGDYFAWRETEPKSNYNWSTYQYSNGSSSKLTKYCTNSSYGYNGFTDDLTTLLPEDDAATANWGDDWRMPTKEEWQELYDNTTCTWTTRNGVDGRLFTAANGKSVFLPAAGYRNGTSFSGSTGEYLSSTLYSNIPSRAWELNFGSDNCSMSSYGHRKLGLSVRAVRGSVNHDYVDLGLPSGTLWATCNVGADTPEGYGDHFAWGETTPKSTYNWGTYQHCNGSASTLTKYCTNSSYGYNGFTDNLTTLLPEDDAATANWGEDWRMPVKEELEELYNNTTTTYTTQNGVYGTLFTATNGNSLFLPAEYRYSGELGDDPFGVYWSSSLNTDNPDDAWVLQNDWYWGDHMEGDHGRAGVKSVRAVRSFSQDSSFVINVTAHPEEGGSVSGGGTYQTGTECTLTATPNEGYAFVCWMEYGYVATVSTEPTYSFMVNRSRNLKAVFCNYVSGAYHYVDLGLPSGLLWATCNVGADIPEGYGDYFAWGETQTKDDYSWSTYQHCNGSENTLTKYCKNSSYGYNGFTDGLTTLLPEDDAASVNWGLEWRMPTEQEWWELKRNTTNFLITLNGVDGCLFIAANGNTLFLPKADRRSGNGFDEWIVGNGYCWSSSLCGYDSRQAEYFEFGWDGFFSTWQGVEDDYRFYGQSVRAVRSTYQSFVINATANPVEGGGMSGEGVYLDGDTCTLTATANEGYTFIGWTENGEVVSTAASYSFIVNGSRNIVASFVTSGAYHYVDLGLPSGTLWATCNVGADSPDGFGDYFAWGETQPKSVYNWSTYQHCNGGIDDALTKYCYLSNYGFNGFTDTLTTLLSEDDAATANWGSDWRMPSYEECWELYQNTTQTWTTLNGVNGRLFTASNGSSLFLPAAGYRFDSGVYSLGSFGEYWSTCIGNDYPYVAFEFYSGIDSCALDETPRACGCTIRAVRSAPQN